MAIKYYNPTPQRSREEYYDIRSYAETAIRNIRGEDIDMMFRVGRPVINISGCVVIVNRPDFMKVPLIELGGTESSIRKTKSRLESLIKVKLRKTRDRI